MKIFSQLIELIKQKIKSDSAPEFYWLISGQLLSVLLGFINIKILSKLGPSDYGLYALIITISTLLVQIYYGPIQQGFLRFYYYYFNLNQAKIYINLLYRILFISSVSLISITLIATFIIKSHYAFTSLFIIFIGGFVIIQRTSLFFNSLLNLIRKRKENTLISISSKVTMIILFYVFYIKGMFNLERVIILSFIVECIFCVLKIFIFNKYVPEANSELDNNLNHYRKEMLKKTFQYTLPFLIWGFTGWLQSNGEKWIINEVLTIYDVGIYALMITLVNALISVPISIITEFFSPIIFQNYSDFNNYLNIKKGYQYIRYTIILTYVITIVSVITTILFGKYMIILISSEEYAIYWYILPISCLGMGLFLVGQAQAFIGMVHNLPQAYLSPKILVGALSVLLNFLAIKIFGILGAALSTLIIGLVYVTYINIINKKIIKMFISSNNIY